MATAATYVAQHDQAAAAAAAMIISAAPHTNGKILATKVETVVAAQKEW